MARVCWCFYSLLVLGYTLALVCGQRKDIEKIPLLLPVDELKQVKGLYVKDNENGQLRFLANNANFNNAINQFITQQQNFLEQLRPNGANGGNGANGVPALSINGNGLTGLTGLTTTNGISGLSNINGNNGVNPIVVSLSGTTPAANTGNGNINAAVQALIPQIIANTIANNGVANRRRPVRNRRRPNVIVVRPQAIEEFFSFCFQKILQYRRFNCCLFTQVFWTSLFSVLSCLVVVYRALRV